MLKWEKEMKNVKMRASDYKLCLIYINREVGVHRPRSDVSWRLFILAYTAENSFCFVHCFALYIWSLCRLSNIAAVLNGIGGCVPFAGPAKLSAIWFPPDQRATATSVMSFANYFGVAMAFVVGKLVFCMIYRKQLTWNCSGMLASLPTDIFLWFIFIIILSPFLSCMHMQGDKRKYSSPLSGVCLSVHPCTCL